MHKTVLLDFDIRPHCCKLSFDVSNAHNEFCRHEAVRAVRTLVPKLLPWVKIGLCTDTSHVHVARDGHAYNFRSSGVATRVMHSPITFSPWCINELRMLCEIH